MAELHSSSTRRSATLSRLVEITAPLNSTLKLEELLGLIMSSATDLLDAETSSLLLLDEASGELDGRGRDGRPGRGDR